MQLWWWQINLARWHQRHCVGSKSQVHKQVSANLVEVHGVKAQDEHLILTSNRWANRKGELSYLTIYKELCDDKSTRLGGPIRVGRVLLQEFKAFNNGGVVTLAFSSRPR
jgi:hypothetical protein